MIALETAKFSYNAHDRSFSAEASDVPEFDLVGEGPFYLVSQWTGKAARANHFFTCRDRERDVLYWDYNVPDANCTVRVFND